MGDPSNYYSNAIPQSRPSKCTLVIQFYRFHGKLRILSALEIIAFSTGREYNSQFILFEASNGLAVWKLTDSVVIVVFVVFLR